MGCFSLSLIVQFLVIGAIIAGVYMIATYLLSKIPLGEPFPSIVYVVRIILWVFIAIWIIYFLADLISCAFGSGGIGNFGRIRP